MKTDQNIYVTGDVITDMHIYCKSNPALNNNKLIGTQSKPSLGGAYLPFSILKEIFKASENKKFSAQFGLKKNIASELNKSNQRSYAIWIPFQGDNDQIKENKNQKYWRLQQRMGYGNIIGRDNDYSAYFEEGNKPTIVVIDDSNIHIRFSVAKNIWPLAIKKKNKSLKWIVHKMSHPVATGYLWQHLSSLWVDQLVSIVPVHDLRKEEVAISQGLSWERTALDLIYELTANPAASRLLNCRHLIIYFGTEGALYVKDANKDKSREFILVFDPVRLEGDWDNEIEGSAIGFMSCLTAAVTAALAQDNKSPNIIDGIKSGLSAMRRLLSNGHGKVEKGTAMEFPTIEIAKEINMPSHKYSVAHKIPIPTAPQNIPYDDWSIIKSQQEITGPMYGIAKQIALWGVEKIGDIPYANFGALYTVDRNEIESLRTIQKLMRGYKDTDKANKPLSIGVFGPPGSGKSFGIKQLAKGILGKSTPILEFNLSQFSNSHDLIGAFHQVRDEALKGEMPVVFWDEFDSTNYKWLQYLLAPMQDGQFQDGQLTHPIGKCICIFAGGTSSTYEHFGPSPSKDKEKEEREKKEFKLLKGPDFISRLNGYLNVLGPNQKKLLDRKTGKEKNDKNDQYFPLRRALLIRGMLRLKPGATLNIDSGLLTALLEAPEYHHGSRSIEKILLSLLNPNDPVIRRSKLPSASIMSIHTNYDKFVELLNRNLEYKLLAKALAPLIHKYYQTQTKEKNKSSNPEMNEPFNKLSLDFQASNIAAAERASEVFSLIGLKIVKKDALGKIGRQKIEEIIDKNIELLAKREHDLWMENRINNGWIFNKDRSNEKREHPSLVPYPKLLEEDKEKNRFQVRHFPSLLTKIGYKFVKI